MDDLVIIGAGGHAREMLDAVEARNRVDPAWRFLGFLADGERHPERAVARGVEILGGVDHLAALDALFLIGIGSPAARAEIDRVGVAAGRRSPSLVHPTAVVGSHVVLEPGAYVAASAVVTTNVHVGRHAHLNVGATVAHECVVGDYAIIGPGAHLAGNVSVGRSCEIGIGAVVGPRVRIGDGAVVGAGAAVVDDVAPGTVVVGVPARPLTRH